jgi:hypothetical protein
VRELSKLLQSNLDVVSELLEEARRVCGAGAGQLTREAQVGAQSDELLLGAVVEIALDPPALGVRGRDDAGTGGAELLGLALDLVE